jgi:hypothetical protein
MNVRTSNCAADGGDFFTVGALDPGYGSDHVFCYQLVLGSSPGGLTNKIKDLRQKNKSKPKLRVTGWVTNLRPRFHPTRVSRCGVLGSASLYCVF